MKVKIYFGICLLGFALSGCMYDVQTQHRVEDRVNEIPLLFEQAKAQAVFITYDGNQINRYGNDLTRANTQYIPASTFKMLNALIGLQHHKATATEVFKWHGEKRLFSFMGKRYDFGRGDAGIGCTCLSGTCAPYWS